MIHLVAVVALLAAEPAAPHPPSLTEQQLADLRALVYKVKRRDMALKSELFKRQQDLIESYSDYRLDAQRIIRLQEETSGLQRQLLENYHFLQTEIRRITGPESFEFVRRRADLFMQAKRLPSEAPPDDEAPPKPVEGVRPAPR